MRNLFLVLFTLLLTSAFAQMPETADSVYWSAKFCDTAENTLEAHLTQWTWNGNVGDCIQPSIEFATGTNMCDQLYPEIWLFDSYDCCCKVASLPGSEAVWTGFMDSDCPAYLDSIGFIYNDPDYINWTSLSEMDLELDGIYIDMYGRQYIAPPKGISIMNRKTYIRLN